MSPKLPSSLTVLLEPTDACNLRCKHCYHAKSNYNTSKMSIDTLRQFLSVCVLDYSRIVIIWHGGEPLLMGADFFSKAYQVFDEYSKKYSTKFSFRLQTNGTLLDDRLIDFFIRTNTFISISFDGRQNEILRQQTGLVEQTINNLRNRGVPFACMSTVSSANINYLQDLYGFFKGLKVPTKLSVIIPDGAAIGSEYLVSKEVWTQEFIKLFECWFFDIDCNIEMPACSDMLIKYLNTGKILGCSNGLCLFGYIAVNDKGNVYPCGRLIEDRYKIANVYDINSIAEAFLSEKFLDVYNKCKQRISLCKSCKWFDKCHSGCMAMASAEGDISYKSSFECYFTQHVFNKIEELMTFYDSNKTNPYVNKIIRQMV